MFGKRVFVLLVFFFVLSSCVSPDLEYEFDAGISVVKGDTFDVNKPIISGVEFKVIEDALPIGVSTQNKIKHLEKVAETDVSITFKANIAGETRIVGRYYNEDGTLRSYEQKVSIHITILD
ncbi:hypothetical protein EP331_15190 [bacterium]|nr:MAG: hypothetical protein EP331_15190 [bacterium]